MLGKSSILVRLAFTAILFLSFIGTTESRYQTVVKEIEANRAAVLYDRNLKMVYTERVYQPGRYHVGINQTFIKYRISEQKIEFSSDDFTMADEIHVKDDDGNSFAVELSVFYKLQKYNIGKLYEAHKMNYEKKMIKSIYILVIEMFKELKFEDYYGFDKETQLQNKQKTAKKLQNILNKLMEENYFANCNSVEFLWFKLSSLEVAAMKQKYNIAEEKPDKKQDEKKKEAEEANKEDNEKKGSEEKKSDEEKKDDDEKKGDEEKKGEDEKKDTEKKDEEKKSEDKASDQKNQVKIDGVEFQKVEDKTGDRKKKNGLNSRKLQAQQSQLIDQNNQKNKLTLQKQCQEAIRIEMFESGKCLDTFKSNSDYRGSFAGGVAHMMGSCQGLSKERNGKLQLLSSYVQCDSEGYTTTTYFGSSDCFRQENREQGTTRKIVTRGQWTKCKQHLAFLAEEKKAAVKRPPMDPAGAFLALKASVISIAALAVSQLF